MTDYTPTPDEKRVIAWLRALPNGGKVRFWLRVQIAWLALADMSSLWRNTARVFADYLERGEHHD